MAALTRRALLGAVVVGTAAACTSNSTAAPAEPTSLAPQPFPVLGVDAGTVTAFPLPGARYAPPLSEISLRGKGIGRGKAWGQIVITGSHSGEHTYTPRPHADGDGVSLVVTTPFTAGEKVSVTTDLALRGTTSGMTTFGVATVIPTQVGPDIEGIDASQVQAFATEPDLSVAKITVQTDEPSAARGRIFLSPYRGPGVDGPMLLDDHGELLWARPVPDGQRAANFQAQTWQGRPVLTWWQGEISQIGDSTGVDYIYDDGYRQIAEIRGGNGLSADLHDFVITPAGTALILSYMHCRADLSAHGGPSDGIVIDGVIQELEIDTGRVLFEWHALDHIDLGESYQPMTKSATAAYDAFHLNSITKDDQGDYLLSSRATHTIYRIDGGTGAVLWRLGGRRSNFRLGAGAAFSSQHDARWVDADTISLFDNAAGVGAATAKNSAALVLRLDTTAQTATVMAMRSRGATSQSLSQGSTQVLGDGHIFIGWGAQPYVTEYDAAGAVVFAAAMPSADQSYRAFRLPWTGHPSEAPRISSLAVSGGHQVAMSWNGATEVARWQVLTGDAPDRLKPHISLTRKGFETSAVVRGLSTWVAARALDSEGRVLGTSDPLRT